MSGIMNWPLDENGKPMQLVTFGVEEKIGLPNYSNVTIGPAAVWRFIGADEPVDEACRKIKEDLDQTMHKLRDEVLADRPNKK